MNSVVLNTANAKTEEAHRLRLNLTSDLKLEGNLISLSTCNIYYTWKNIKAEYGNNEISYTHLPTNSVVQAFMPDGSYSIRDINNYIYHTLTLNKHENVDGTFGINIYANAVYNRVTISVSSDFELQLKDGMLETLGFELSQNVITNTDINGTLVPKLERVDTVYIHCNLVDNRITHNSSILHAFTPNKSFGNLLTIEPNYPQNRYCRNTSFSYIEVYFTDQDERPLEIEDRLSVEIQIYEKINLVKV